MAQRNVVIVLMTALLIAAATALSAPSSAAEACPHQFGSPQQRVDAAGTVVQEWTIAGLQKSEDVLPGYTPRGQLWQATATLQAVKGTVTPLIPSFYAAAPGGQRVGVLWQAATPQGIAPTTLAQGQSSTGKIYFDVIGEDPMGIVYNDGAGELLMWCCESGMTMSMPMSMPMDRCPMCAARDCPCPHRNMM
ncbi:hypothetical protein MGALJ_61460 (plasmid) [Mycobacterium gallinarum]|uniref:MPT63-like domain-containing protein n=1 Tax=Mycobacterium gallinarum TaxID=39689 RepID=A0A9W4FIK0_9MYCO|nr:MPT63 family protein [Mycobacterium gallinarum]BBY96477.1 hypothetical protein MGALJ_61460 [Mycobacterium gallinarum]